MKAIEVLNKYAAGERNFQGANLRGQSFRGEDLSGADFSQADLRGANFDRANLKETNFAGVQCGLRKRWAISLTILFWLLAAVSGFFSIFAASIFQVSRLENQITGWLSLIIINVFLILMIRHGIRALTLLYALVAGIMAYTVASAAVGAIAFTIAGAGATVVAGRWAGTIAFILAGAGAGVGALSIAPGGAEAFAVAIAGAGASAVTGAFISWRALRGDARDAWIYKLALALGAGDGTSFRNANLTDANFAAAKLKSADLRDAVLTRVRWYRASMLDRSRLGDSYLQRNQIRQWLVGDGTDNNFDGQQLEGINFQGADLRGASFIGTNLTGANLQNANLAGAKLVGTQLDQTDLTDAILTGACVEDWRITSRTILESVECQYIFHCLPRDNDAEFGRKPDNHHEYFRGNDFINFIKPPFDTLDLYHNGPVDSRAIAISWQNLAERNPDAAIRLASIEAKGQDNLLLRLKTAPNVNWSQLSADYFTTYNHLKTSTESEFKRLTVEEDIRIQLLETMVMTALECPTFHREG